MRKWSRRTLTKRKAKLTLDTKLGPSYKYYMSNRNDLHYQYQVLLVIHWLMVMISVPMGILLIFMLLGSGDALATPIGLAGMVVTFGSMAYAAKEIKGHKDGGEELAFWERSIRTMTSISMGVSLLLVIFPFLPI